MVFRKMMSRHSIEIVRKCACMIGIDRWIISMSAYSSQEILLDCDQSNVLLAHIIFCCILLRAFSFLLACVRDPASN